MTDSTPSQAAAPSGFASSAACSSRQSNAIDAPGQPPTLPVWPSDVLLKGQTRIRIDHQGQSYWLQHTRQGKLILTK